MNKPTRWQRFKLRMLDLLADGTETAGDVAQYVGRGIRDTTVASWNGLRWLGGKLKPSYSVVWTAIWVPAFFAALWFGMQTFGSPTADGGNSFDDLFAYLIEIGTRSFPLLVSIALTYLVAGRLDWNIDNTERAGYQRILAGKDEGNAIGAFTILAGEMVSILTLLIVFLRALLLWQGAGA